jgi:CRISPR/Cas system CSM-associated protein Csm2 small subunit
MKKITSVNVVTQTDMTVFYKDIEGISAMIENNGSEVEIQYQFHWLLFSISYRKKRGLSND